MLTRRQQQFAGAALFFATALALWGCAAPSLDRRIRRRISSTGFAIQPASQRSRGAAGHLLRDGDGDRAVTYQWQKNSANISGAISPPTRRLRRFPATMALPFAWCYQLGGHRDEQFGHSDRGCGPPVAPSITTQPANQTVIVGADGHIYRRGGGHGAALPTSGRKDSANIVGATSASYTTPATVAGDNGATFRVMVTNSVTSITSNSATLTVNPRLSRHPEPTSPPITTTLLAPDRT